MTTKSGKGDVSPPPLEPVLDEDEVTFIRSFARTLKNLQTESVKTEPEPPKEPPKHEKVLQDTEKTFNAQASKPDSQYLYGEKPIHYELEEKRDREKALADSLLALVHLHSGTPYAAEKEDMLKIVAQGAQVVRSSQQHYDRLGDKVKRAHYPHTIARKPKLGTKDRIPNVRPGQFPIYTGGNGQDIMTYIHWIDQLFGPLEGYTARVHLEVIGRYVQGAALTTVMQWQNAQKDNLFEVLASLEQHVAGVVSPEIAENALSRITIGSGDSINQVSSVIVAYSMMVHINAPEEERPRLRSETSKRVLLRIIPPALRKQYEEFARHAQLSGRLEISYKETVKMLIEFNQSNIDARENYKSTRNVAKAMGNVSSLDFLSVNKKHTPLLAAAKRVDYVQGEPLRDGLCGLDNDSDEELPPEPSNIVSYSEVCDTETSEPEDDPDAQDVFYVQKKYTFSPGMFGVKDNECYRCGQSTHRYRGKTANACPLIKHKLTYKPCSSCHKGGHAPEHCPRAKN